MGGKLSGKVAIVTGAAQGIGASYAAALSAEGAQVCVSDVLDTAASVTAAKAAGGDAFGISCDVTDSESVKAMVDATFARWGRVDILVNNAGIFGNLSLNATHRDIVCGVRQGAVRQCPRELRVREGGRTAHA